MWLARLSFTQETASLILRLEPQKPVRSSTRSISSSRSLPTGQEEKQASHFNPLAWVLAFPEVHFSLDHEYCRGAQGERGDHPQQDSHPARPVFRLNAQIRFARVMLPAANSRPSQRFYHSSKGSSKRAIRPMCKKNTINRSARTARTRMTSVTTNYDICHCDIRPLPTILLVVRHLTTNV